MADVKNTTLMPQLLNTLKKLTKKDCIVGILNNFEEDDTKMSNHQLGYMYEYGEPALNIPSSNFLSIGMERGIKHGMGELIENLDSVLSLQSDPSSKIYFALDNIGKQCVTEVEKVAPKTLQDHIEYKVE